MGKLEDLLNQLIEEAGSEEEVEKLLMESLYEMKHEKVYDCIKEGPAAFSRDKKWQNWCKKRIAKFKKEVRDIIKRNKWDIVEVIEAVYAYADKEEVLDTDWGFYGNLVAIMEEIEEIDPEQAILKALRYWEA